MGRRARTGTPGHPLRSDAREGWASCIPPCLDIDWKLLGIPGFPARKSQEPWLVQPESELLQCEHGPDLPRMPSQTGAHR